jgi:SAM-dependent methyltransferase
VFVISGLKRLWGTLVYDVPFRFTHHRPELFDHLRALPAGASVLNLGSGKGEFDRHVGRPMLGVDLRPGPGVRVLADAERLPFRDGSFDAVFSRDVFEHLPHPWTAAAEVGRVLRPGGIACICAPLHFPVHDEHDYYRFTSKGLHTLFEELEPVDHGIAIGPGAFLAVYLTEYLLSFVPTRSLQLAARLVLHYATIPLRLSDRLPLSGSQREKIPQGFYFVGRRSPAGPPADIA